MLALFGWTDAGPLGGWNDMIGIYFDREEAVEGVFQNPGKVTSFNIVDLTQADPILQGTVEWVHTGVGHLIHWIVRRTDKPEYTRKPTSEERSFHGYQG